ncbi:MAG: ECF-type sigma factor [Pseudomonadota bacterium]
MPVSPIASEDDKPAQTLTALLNTTEDGGGGVAAAFEHVYDELRRLAQHQLCAERPDHTLSATALVNEAYLKLAAQDRSRWENRAQFFSVASTAMRRILVNHARDRSRQKRGGGAQRVDLDRGDVLGQLVSEDRYEEILTVDRLLEGLGQVDPRASRVTECRYFAGYTNEETAAALDLSVITVKRSWRLARAWMARELGREAANGPA